jgi:CRISPR/Cas system-associated exonuclease Cas4 (RecB family)
LAEQEARQSEGLFFHRLIQQHLLGIPAGQLAALATTPNLARWWQNYTSADFGFQEDAHRGEVALSHPVGGHRLLAKYDVISVHNGRATIYDWKTYARRPGNEWLAARWQTRIYRAVLALAGSSLSQARPFEPAQISMVYWFAEFPHDPAHFDYDVSEFDRDVSAIEKIVQEISTAAFFPPTEDQRMCRNCVYRSYCDRGERPGRSQDYEGDTDDGASGPEGLQPIGEMDSAYKR